MRLREFLEKKHGELRRVVLAKAAWGRCLSEYKRLKISANNSAAEERTPPAGLTIKLGTPTSPRELAITKFTNTPRGQRDVLRYRRLEQTQRLHQQPITQDPDRAPRDHRVGLVSHREVRNIATWLRRTHQVFVVQPVLSTDQPTGRLSVNHTPGRSIRVKRPACLRRPLGVHQATEGSAI